MSVRATLWAAALLALVALRLPAWVTPVGSDQYLYVYIADVVRSGGVPYVDAWDQKPPGVYFVYGLLRTFWPYTSVVALADALAAACLAGLLVLLGRRTGYVHAGYVAAALALLLGHPSLSRLDGVYVRGQCETFVAPAVVAALATLVRAPRSRLALLSSGVALAVAFWLKYNALAYALPIAAAIALWSERPFAVRSWIRELATVAAGFLAVSAVVLGWFAWRGGLSELWVATILYNLDYSGETYDTGFGSALSYLVTMPVAHARTDLLWFLGGLGAVALLIVRPPRRDARVAGLAVAWLAATVLSIAINGARDLPQYFVQAVPAMAFAAAAGLAAAWQAGRGWQLAMGVMIVAGLWRTGVEAPVAGGWRFGDLPELVSNIRFDLARSSGAVDTRTYLSRFKGAQKYDALANFDLAEHIRATTDPRDPILVFGFAPGVYVESGRASASRFFWSRPIVVEFADERPGFGPDGLLEDLQARPPAIVALQKKDWGETVESHGYFHGRPALREWLVKGYTLESDSSVFEVWRASREPTAGTSRSQ